VALFVNEPHSFDPRFIDSELAEMTEHRPWQDGES